MKEITREQLSAFVDDELDAGETELLVRRFGDDFDLRGAAVRYGLIGDVIREELLPGDPRVLPARVSAAIGSEPRWRSTVGGRRLLRPVAGAAVAASVAALAIFSISEPDRSAPGSAAVTVPETSVTTVAPMAAPTAGIFRAGSPSQLSRYYLNHSEYATMLGGQGTLIRIVRAPEEPAAPEEDTEPSVGSGDKTEE